MVQAVEEVDGAVPCGTVACAAEHGLCAVARAGRCGIVRVHQLERGDRLNEDPGARSSVRTVRTGLAAMCLALPDGRRQIVHLAGPGESLPAGSVLAGGGWIEALSVTEVCEVEFDGGDGKVALDAPLLAALLALAEQRFEDSARRIVALGRTDGTERVIGFLADITPRLGRQDGQCWRVHLPLSREDIADYLGLNAETVSRILGRIKRADLAVFRTPTELEVPDLQRLSLRSPLHVTGEAAS